jgi:hypothetical protein
MEKLFGLMETYSKDEVLHLKSIHYDCLVKIILSRGEEAKGE